MNGEPLSDPLLIQLIYESVASRQSVYDGIYYTGVHTTGIFCRPSCRARTPLLKNISFYSSIDDALQAGFRPCKRCKPELPGPAGPEALLVQAARRAMDEAMPHAVPLDALAAGLHVSPFYLQRLFKRHTGISPAEYTSCRKMELACRLLLDTDMDVAQVSNEAGFSSPAYFSAFFTKRAGCSPTAYRQQHTGKSL